MKSKTFNNLRIVNQCIKRHYKTTRNQYKFTQWDKAWAAQQYLEYGSLPQQPFRQVLPGKLSGCLQLLIPISGLEKHQHKQLQNTEKQLHIIEYICLVCWCVQLRPPVQVCAPHNPDGRCRRPRHGHSPWRGLPAERSSCTPGRAWRSSQRDASGPCSKKRKYQHITCLVFFIYTHTFQKVHRKF